MFRNLVRLGAINGFLAVALGAFGAHGLKGKIAPDLLEVYGTGAEYHLTHALAIFAAAFLAERFEALEGENSRAARLARVSGILFAVGIVVFSGSLYTLALTGIRWLGAITPIGGACFLTGWAMLALAASLPRQR
jgi:uncharacterized membrane protein YgdD (TMEM256/DUF423 family)